MLTADKRITGDFTIANGVIASGEGESRVTVSFKAGSNPSAFYIPVPTGEYNITAELQKGGVAIEGTQKTTSEPKTIARTTLLLIEDIEVVVPELLTEIKTAEDFLSFVNNAKAYEGSEGITLAADIELPETFVPDTLYCPFDGQGHTVTYNLTVAEGAAHSGGLFSQVQADVKNLRVAGSVTTRVPDNGGIAGTSTEGVTFQNCENNVNILTDIYGVSVPHMGGIVGKGGRDNKFIGCVNNGKIETIIPNKDKGRAAQLAGIAGYVLNVVLFQDCVNNGQITYSAQGTSRIGGIVGYPDDLQDMRFVNCTNNGLILADVNNAGSGYQYVGGITSYYATNHKNEDNNSVPYAGARALYDHCINNGNLTVLGNSGKGGQTRMGGIAAYLGTTDANMKNAGFTEGCIVCEFRDCENNGEVTTDGTVANNIAGGIIGFGETSAKAVVSNCANKGKISVAGTGSAGGILGGKTSTLSEMTDISVLETSHIETVGAGKAGLVAGSNAAFNTTMTGKVAGTVSVGGSATKATAGNYRNYLFGAVLGEAANTEGIVFDGEAGPEETLVNLSDGGLSNCYIVSQAGYYSIVAKDPKGNAFTGSKVDWVWCTGTSRLLSDLNYKDGVITFRVAEMSQNSEIIALLNDSGKVVWSWHIWATDAAGQTYGGVTMLDRDPGAHAVDAALPASVGFYYQWGRKDPFPGTRVVGRTLPSTYESVAFGHEGEYLWTEEYLVNTALTGSDMIAVVKNECSLEDGIAHPATWYGKYNGGGWSLTNAEVADFWGGVSLSKGVQDPCPAGYRVSTLDELLDFNKSITDAGGKRSSVDGSWGQIIVLDGVTYNYPAGRIRAWSGPLQTPGNPCGFWGAKVGETEHTGEWYWNFSAVGTAPACQGAVLRCIKQ